MTQRMLIEATHAEETRVVVADGNRLAEYDYETSTKKQLKGNIYLAKVTRVEPSLQAAFVDYGGNRHGFLAFNEIHPDYYRIPVEDREALLAAASSAEDGDDADADEAGGNGEHVEVLGGDETDDIQRIGAAQRQRVRNRARQYKIQEVIKRRQILLVQVVKEERGNKGTALTTYLSMAGRYCVLMPNTARGGGISRKITNLAHRKRLKSLLSELGAPPGMAVILRTAGVERTKPEIKRDYEYLRRLWDEIRELTLKSTAPALIYEEANIVKRSLRDLYTREIEEVLIDGDEAYKAAKHVMKTMIPSHAKRVKKYEDPTIPLFHRFKIESQLDEIHDHIVNLRSGGYIVINPTEALVSIDVNSGRSTRERNIEQTALRTNLEAASEVARQLRLRDLAGLIVIDFIDMDESRNNSAVERRLKEAMKGDRARIQVGRISPFGLLELSRQRLRPSLIEASTLPCPSCGGTGSIRSIESTALKVLRAIEEEGIRKRNRQIAVHVPTTVALYILNQKRPALNAIEVNHALRVLIATNDALIPPDYTIEQIKELEPATNDHVVRQIDLAAPEPTEEPTEAAAEVPTEEPAEAAADERGRRRRRRGRRRPGEEADTIAPIQQAVTADEGAEDAEDTEVTEADEAGVRAEAQVLEGGGEGQRRRRGRRGGRRRSRRDATAVTEDMASPPAGEEPALAEPAVEAGAADATPEAPSPEAPSPEAPSPEAPSPESEGATAPPRPRRRRRASRAAAKTEAAAPLEGAEGAASAGEAAAAAADDAPDQPAKPRRRRAPRRRVRERAPEAALDSATGEPTGEPALPPTPLDRPAEPLVAATPVETSPPATPDAGSAEFDRDPDAGERVTAADVAEVPDAPRRPAVRAPQLKSAPTGRSLEAEGRPIAEGRPVNGGGGSDEDTEPHEPSRRRGWWDRLTS